MKNTQPEPVSWLPEASVYRVPRPRTPVDLYLDGNEGSVPGESLLDCLRQGMPDVLRRYPDPSELEELLAERHGVDRERVLVTAGGDEVIERVMRAFLCPGRELVIPWPSFEMIERYARMVGGDVVRVPWPGGTWPLQAVLASVTDATSVIALVSPNNPTGAVATAADLRSIADSVPQALILVDLAYTEFADEDLTRTALEIPNAVVLRSFSKAWGLAGLRLGCALASPRIAQRLRSVGAPYAVSAPSLALAGARLRGGESEMNRFVERVRFERAELTRELRELGASPGPSQANFVLARFSDATGVQEGLAGLGIAVRSFPGQAELQGCLRITCPGDRNHFDRLIAGLETVVRPEALLLDLDGVLADVSSSYRLAIIETARTFGVALRDDEVIRAKARGGANNDWELTRRLIESHGVDCTQDVVTGRFEEIYQGTNGRPGLWRRETLIPTAALLQRLASRLPLGVVTGRPREDAERFLSDAGIAREISVVVAMEDAPAKPDPRPVRLALERLRVSRAWMVGDTPDDMSAARAADVVPWGIVPPQLDPAAWEPVLVAAGGARVLGSLTELEEMLS
jgi:histidinol-phosphate aminotransferase